MLIADLIDDCARSMGFLSRYPVPGRFFAGHDGQMGRTIRGFPVAGLAIALPAAVVLFLADRYGASPLIAAILAIGLQTIITGALHDDGLADTADGLGGGRNAESALVIMKDSRIGTYGALALMLTLSLRVAAVTALMAHLSPLPVALIWLGIAMASRTAMVWHWSSLPPARKDGVAAGVGSPEPDAATICYAIGLAGSLVLFVLAAGFTVSLLSLVVSGLILLVATRHIGTRLGGHTGDTIGFSQQMTEASLLTALALLT